MQDRFAGNWKQIQGKIKQRWGELTDDDVARIEGRREELVGRLQAKYSYTKQRAEQEIDNFMDEMERRAA